MRRLGAALIAGGAVVWTTDVVAWVSGVWVTLPPDTVRVLVLSLLAVSGGSLVTAGALIGRTRRAHMAAQLPGVHDASQSPQQLPEASASLSSLRARATHIDDRVT
ncbi:MAG TPA: hypothetical protein VF929_03285 [Gemmatimonadaceae bacterium]